MMDAAKLYARREPCVRHGVHGYGQVAAYGRPGDVLPVAVWPCMFESCPKRGAKHAMVNCYRYALEWLPDLIGPPVHVGEMKMRAMGYGAGLVEFRRAIGA